MLYTTDNTNTAGWLRILLNFILILILPGGFFDDASTVDANTAAHTNTVVWIRLMLLLLILLCRFC